MVTRRSCSSLVACGCPSACVWDIAALPPSTVKRSSPSLAEDQCCRTECRARTRLASALLNRQRIELRDRDGGLIVHVWPALLKGIGDGLLQRHRPPLCPGRCEGWLIQ